MGGTPWPCQDGGDPIPGQGAPRTTEGVLATWQAVCLLRSRRRTFLLQTYIWNAFWAFVVVTLYDTRSVNWSFTENSFHQIHNHRGLPQTHKIVLIMAILHQSLYYVKTKQIPQKMLPYWALNLGHQRFGSDALLCESLKDVLLGIPLN